MALGVFGNMEPAKKMSDNESQKVDDELQPESEVSIEQGSIERGRRRRRSKSLSSELSVNMDELRALIQLIRENEFTEFELEREGFRVRFRRGGAGQIRAKGAAPCHDVAGAVQHVN